MAELEYDAKIIPGGYSRDEIKIFLRSEGEGWKVLPTVSHDKGRNRISANVPHFSEIAAGFLSAPSESQTRFNVNTKLPEFKLPDPLGGRTMIASPQPNLSGSLAQSIPVALPPGRDGLTPGLAISYDSGRGNGVCGIGWSIPQEGITRDTRKGIPSYTTNDIFFLNGQELVYSNGTSSPRIYRLKNEGSFLRIEFYPSNVGGDGYWKTIKDGVVSTYGSAVLNRGEIPGKSVSGAYGTFGWQLTERARFGHSIYYDYGLQNGRNELTNISYQDDSLKIVFDYSNRSDVLHFAGTGLYSTETNLLVDFQIQEKLTSGSWAPVRTYELSYTTNGGGDSLLQRVRLLHEDNTKTLEDINFSYGDFSYLLSSELDVNAGTNAIPYDLFRRQMMDVNGDGLVDIAANLEGISNTTGLAFQMYTNTGSLFTNAGVWVVSNGTNAASERLTFMDGNSDGKPDAVIDYTGLEGSGTIYRLFTNMGSGWIYASDWSNASDNSRCSFSDFDGDGRPDVAVYQYGLDGTVGSNTPSWDIYTNTVTGFSQTSITFTAPEVVGDQFVSLKDMNGDRKPDLVVNNDGLGTNCYTIYFNTGSNFQSFSETNRSPDVSAFRKKLIDMNGDGRPDLVVSSNGYTNGVW
ncbi:MAG: VCBS repeat-containing protein, partial [Spirochaetia bacterium]|nr:VCBS repeat-containing protein [Spirochaetia bacterium]